MGKSRRGATCCAPTVNKTTEVEDQYKYYLGLDLGHYEDFNHLTQLLCESVIKGYIMIGPSVTQKVSEAFGKKINPSA